MTFHASSVLEGGDFSVKEGDVFESVLDGRDYVVKGIVNKMVVLGSRKGDREILTGIDTLKITSLYRRKEKTGKALEQSTGRVVTSNQ
jgi:hypothetical protein